MDVNFKNFRTNTLIHTCDAFNFIYIHVKKIQFIYNIFIYNFLISFKKGYVPLAYYLTI